MGSLKSVVLVLLTWHLVIELTITAAVWAEQTAAVASPQLKE